MTTQLEDIETLEISPVVMRLQPVIEMTDDQFYQLCQLNQDLRIERTAIGELIIMPPVGGEGSKRNADLTIDLGLWNRQTKLGIVFDSSGGFKLPNGAERSPDAAWVRLDQWNTLTPQQKKRFPPLCPDFIIELRSETDNLTVLQEKMQEYMANGCRLGWLIDPKTQKVEIYRPRQTGEILQSPTILSGEDVLPGFVLDLKSIFDFD
jgi:Uma2 family endonuclease